MHLSSITATILEIKLIKLCTESLGLFSSSFSSGSRIDVSVNTTICTASLHCSNVNVQHIRENKTLSFVLQKAKVFLLQWFFDSQWTVYFCPFEIVKLCTAYFASVNRLSDQYLLTLYYRKIVLHLFFCSYSTVYSCPFLTNTLFPVTLKFVRHILQVVRPLSIV